MYKSKPITLEDVKLVLEKNPTVDQTIKWVGNGKSKLEKHMEKVDRILAELDSYK